MRDEKIVETFEQKPAVIGRKQLNTIKFRRG
jgi:hypothetical protein